MKFFAKGQIKTLIVVVLIILAIGGSLLLYNIRLGESILGFSEMSHHEIATLGKFSIEKEMSAEITLIKNIASSFENVINDKPEILKVMNRTIKESNFENTIIIGIDGTGMFNDETPIYDSYEREYFQRAIKGEACIGRAIQSKLNPDTMVIPVAAPIYIQDKIEGVFVGTYNALVLDTYLFASFESKGTTTVINTSGLIIASTNKTHMMEGFGNLYSMLETATFEKGYSLEEIKTSVSKGEIPICSQYYLYNEFRYVHFTPLSVNGWYLVSVMPQSVVSENTKKATTDAIVLALFIILCFAISLRYISSLQKKYTKSLYKIAYYDEFTGAPTLAKFKIEAQKFVDSNSDSKCLMVKFDISKFKIINEKLGIEVGNAVIRNFAKALYINTPGEGERFARLHDDEFIVLHTYNELKDVDFLNDNFLDVFYKLMGESFNYEISMVSGLYYMTEDNCTNVESAIEKANIAHGFAKQSGSERVTYDKAMLSKLLSQKEIENNMKSALVDKEFKVYLQPKYALTTETIVGAEALVRWKRKDGSLVFPNDFIPLFEQNGFIIKLDMFMFESVCKLIKGWIDSGMKVVPVSVNFSRHHLKNENFVSELEEIANRYNVPKKYLELELTETVIFDNEEVLDSIVCRLHESGFLLSMDDFGTGYSSLGLLKNLPVDIIKIDKGLFAGDRNKSRERTVVESVLEMTRKLKIITIAEGVETQEHIDLLKECGCDMVQGYYYCKPITVEEFVKLLNK